jgi:arginyl-tRNA synthetase
MDRRGTMWHAAEAMSVDLVPVLRQRVRDAIDRTFGEEHGAVDPAIHRSAHADYQADVALALARPLRRSPRDVAAALVEQLPPDDLIAEAAVSGPGFINLTIRDEHLDAALGRMLADDRVGVPPADRPETVVVDYSAPNVAKEMLVHHLRSTIIGDAIVRLLDFEGHRVIRQNHVGDWGTPFGMLIEHLLDEQAAGRHSTVRELAEFYRAARARFDDDAPFAERARRRVVLLQGGDPATLALWRRLVDASMDHFSALYDQLGVTLRPEDVAGESRYNDALAAVVSDLERAGLARPSEGAMCVFLPGFTGRDGQPLPLIVRKQDGGYTYATTDLAALRHRTQVLGARRVIYVVGSPQSQHLAMVFETARRAGWVDAGVCLEHVAFGSVLGQDKKMLRTRAGDAVSLASLLDEAVERAARVVEAKSPHLEPDARARIAAAVGIGAVKYADLSNDRIKDYVFDWDRMLALDGNTAPYLMYAHTRIHSILRRSGIAERDAAARAIRVAEPAERGLALELLEFPATVEKTGETLQPHRVCGNLYAIATAFMTFYERCPVLRAEEPTRASRLALCALTARTLARGLDLLGIAAPDQL